MYICMLHCILLYPFLCCAVKRNSLHKWWPWNGAAILYTCIIISTFSGAPPSLPELLRLQVPEGVGANYRRFGILLLNDERGNRVDTIISDCRGIAEDIMLKVLQEWLKGKGLPATWKSLIQTLRDIKLSTLADQMETAKLSCWWLFYWLEFPIQAYLTGRYALYVKEDLNWE